ncbi:MAG: DUF427 domain-containing protein [Deltaproteobacteria bacterium]|nr:MAG: DUF427 domain-containing protein [Deltaproteobacteria bacterium]
MRSIPEWARRGRSGWRYVGQERPPFAVAPAAGQESVWDYPRPPRVEPDAREVVVRVGATEIARTRRSVRVLETASPPTFYIPREDVRSELLEPSAGSSRCEWKGEARYWNVILPDQRLGRVAWSYPDPFPGFEAIRDHLSFYPARVECGVGSIRVEPQPGRFYGGWVTPEIVGPFKGEPGSEGW